MLVRHAQSKVLKGLLTKEGQDWEIYACSAYSMHDCHLCKRTDFGHLNPERTCNIYFDKLADS